MRLLALSVLTLSLLSAQPRVTKVEPPNWWPGHSINPVRVLVRGEGLCNSRIESTDRSLKLSALKCNERGTYLFFDLSIAATAKPGSYNLKLTSASGSTEIPFTITAPLDRHGRFRGFSSDDVVYLTMPDRFANGDPSNDDPANARGLYDRSKSRYYHGGDLQGIIDHLPYLHDLGVTAIWFTPVYDNANRLNQRETYDGKAITDYHGYGAVDFYGVDEHLGTIDKLRELVDAAHRLGIKVIQDEVANHTGPYHPWVTDSPTPTWFHGTQEHHIPNTWQTWTLIDPHTTAATRTGTLDGWFLNILPDLNQDDPELARYEIQNTLWWIGMTGFDGVREDTLPYVPRKFWRDWTAAIKREYPHFRVVGEVFDGDPALTAFFQGGKTRFDGIDSGVDSVFDFPAYYKVRAAFAQGKPLRDLASTVGHDYLYPAPDLLLPFLGLHDVPRFMSEEGATAAGLKLAWTYTLTTRGIPMIYYGDEIAMRGGADPDNRRDFPGGWADDKRSAFDSAGRTPEENDVFNHVRRLLHLRKSVEALRSGRFVDVAVNEQNWAYMRVGQHETALVVINNDAKASRMSLPCTRTAPLFTSELKTEGVKIEIPDVGHSGEIVVDLPPRSSEVYVFRGSLSCR